MSLTITRVASLSAKDKALHRRLAKYHAALKLALPHIEEAVAAGCKTAAAIAEFLNAKGVPAPSGGKWNLQTVLRARKRLKTLGLHQGSPHFSKARTYRRGAGLTQAQRRAKMALALERLEKRAFGAVICKELP